MSPPDSWVSSGNWIVAFALFLGAGAGVCLWVAARASALSATPARRTLQALLLAEAWWCFTSSAHALVLPLSQRILIAQVQYVGIAAVPVLFCLFAASHANRPWARRRAVWICLFAPGVATVGLAWTNSSHGLIWRAVRETASGLGIEYLHGPWFWAYVAYAYALLAAGTLLLGATALRAEPARRAQAGVLALGLVLPWTGNLVYLTDLISVSGLDLTPLGFSLSSLCLLYAVLRHRLMELTPISRSLIVDRMGDAVLLLDADHRIVDANPAAQALARDERRLEGRLAADALDWWNAVCLPPVLDAPSQVVLSVGGGCRLIEVEAVPVARGSSRGLVVTARDITERRRQEAEAAAIRVHLQEQQRLMGLGVVSSGVIEEVGRLIDGALADVDWASASGTSSAAQAHLDRAVGGMRRASEVARLMAGYAAGAASPGPVDLDAVVREILVLVRASVGRQRHIIYQGAAAPVVIEADAAQVRQAVLHTLINACEAAEEWDVVRVSVGRSVLGAEDLQQAIVGSPARLGPHALLEVADTGRGMDDATLRQATGPSPFLTTSDGTRRLGLAAVAHVMRAHRGVLTVSSSLGHGTRVRAWFPMPA